MSNKSKAEQSKSSKYLKIIFIVVCFLTFYYAFVWMILANLVDPKIHYFDKYSRLENWDLRQHGMDDFDGDGQKDMISFTGCAFLSAAKVEDLLINNALP